MAERTNYFLPFVRQGVTTLADHADVQGKRMTIPVKLKVVASDKETAENQTEIVEKEITLFGPSDLLGINENIIARLTPNPNATNFETSLTPFIEFSEPDFLWRFSSLKTQDKKNWIPWLTLIILKTESNQEEGEFIKIQNSNKELPRQIQLKLNAVLPDLRESWRWAHVHLQDLEGASPEQVANRIKQSSEKVVCRLLSPRKLKPQTKYHAFLVPTFKIGAEAALGITNGVNDRKLLTWETPADGRGKTLPYYFDWEFDTGVQADFENLVRKLKGRDLEGMGTRSIDCSNPGYGMDEKDGLTLEMEAALKSTDTKYQAWGIDDTTGNALSIKKQEQLASLLNKRAEEIDGKIKLRVTPPVYGEWHAGKEGKTISINSFDNSKWLEELNLDFRHRAAAGLGVQFINENQENLMKATWEQFSKIKKVNQELNLGRFGREVSMCMHKRLKNMTSNNLFKIALPVQNKIASDQPSQTVGFTLKNSNVTNTLAQLKVKKYFSKRRVSEVKPEFTPVETTQLVSSGFHVQGLKNPLHDTNVVLYSIAHIPPNSSWPSGVVSNTIAALDPRITIESKIKNRVHRFRAIEKTEVTPNAAEDQLHPVKWYPEFHRPMYHFLKEMSQEYILPGIEKIPPNTVGLLETNRRFIEAFMVGLNHEMASELKWREFPTDMRGSYFRSFWDTSIYSLDNTEKVQFRDTTIGKTVLEQVHKKYGNSYNTLPKIEAAYAKANPTDIEKNVAHAYETAIEKWLLTRDEDKDIEKLSKWNASSNLGDHLANGNQNNGETNQTVLVIRGELLEKFSNTIIYLVSNNNGTPDLNKTSPRKYPIFEGTMPPDIVFLGFSISSDEAKDYFVVFEERISELRFGLDVQPGDSENDFSWAHFETSSEEGYLDGIQPTIQSEDLRKKWNNAGYIGKIMMQKQVRAAIKLEQLLPE